MKGALLVLLIAAIVVAGLGFPSPQDSCQFNGQRYELGSRVPVDSCNICTCDVYGIACTRMMCPEHFDPNHIKALSEGRL